RFKDYHIDTAARLLWRNGERIPLTPRAFETLFCLVKAAGNLVTKEQLLETVWPDAHVEEGNLTQNISVLRRVLGGSEFIETVPKRGYRFAIPVEEIRADAGELPHAEPALEAIPKQTADPPIVKNHAPVSYVP